VNHVSGLRRDGTCLFDVEGKRLILRPSEDGSPNDQGLRLAAGRGGIRVIADHVRVSGFRIEGLAAEAGVRLGSRERRVSDVTVTGIEIGRSRVWSAGVDARHADRSTIHDNVVHNLGAGRGVLASGRENRIVKNTISRTHGTGISMLGGRDCEVVGNHVSDPMGTHANGMAFYINNRRTKIMFNTVFAPTRNVIGIALQNAGWMTIAFNTFVVRQDRAAAHHPTSVNGSPDLGGHLWANNNILTARDDRAWSMDPVGMPGTMVVNNIVDGVSFDGVDALAKRTRNVVTRIRPGVGLRPMELREIEDIVARRVPIFRDLENWDLRPSEEGASVLSLGHRIEIEGRTVDWIGRYRPDGGEAWDWDV
jgi:parallel beta-helix repeat protein